MSFETLKLRPELLRAITELGYDTATPIQLQAIPKIIAGGDVLAAAQTGTGKTAAFTLPLLERLANSSGGNRARVLVLVPTRELAAQVATAMRAYGKFLPLRTAVIFGGVGMMPQTDQLRRGVDIIVATPGRLLDHVGQRTVDLGGIETLVLDEADRMLDMGFIRDIRRLIEVLPKKRQNLMFSATFNDDIRKLAETLLHSPERIDVAPRNTAVQSVEQRVHFVDKSRKSALLSKLIRDGDWHQVLVFTRTKHGANRLAEQLEKDGYGTAALHGNKSQSARTRALADFKSGKVRVLVATDIAARGIDIIDLPHVVNYELPNVPEDYVHRIGRTGRASSTGIAVSLVAAEDRPLLKDIQKLLRKDIPSSIIEGFEPGTGSNAEVAAPRPQQQRRGAPRPSAPSRPAGPKPFNSRFEPQGRPQRDAERIAGKSRKVH